MSGRGCHGRDPVSPYQAVGEPVSKRVTTLVSIFPPDSMATTLRSAKRGRIASKSVVKLMLAEPSSQCPGRAIEMLQARRMATVVKARCPHSAC
jgi:hypothetical protein